MLLTCGVVLRAYATQSEQDGGINRCIDRRASCLLKHPMRTCTIQIPKYLIPTLPCSRYALKSWLAGSSEDDMRVITPVHFSPMHAPNGTAVCTYP